LSQRCFQASRSECLIAASSIAIAGSEGGRHSALCARWHRFCNPTFASSLIAHAAFRAPLSVAVRTALNSSTAGQPWPLVRSARSGVAQRQKSRKRSRVCDAGVAMHREKPPIFATRGQKRTWRGGQLSSGLGRSKMIGGAVR
jgi:hypothetical protein